AKQYQAARLGGGGGVDVGLERHAVAEQLRVVLDLAIYVEIQVATRVRTCGTGEVTASRASRDVDHEEVARRQMDIGGRGVDEGAHRNDGCGCGEGEGAEEEGRAHSDSDCIGIAARRCIKRNASQHAAD